MRSRASLGRRALSRERNLGLAARMSHQFFGAVFAYIHKDGPEYVACLDPFSLLGTGKSVHEALRSLNQQVGPYLAAVSEEIAKHGPHKVHFTRLDDEWKRNPLKVFQGFLFADICHLTATRPQPPPLMAEPIGPAIVNRIAKYFAAGGTVRDIKLAGLQPVAAG